MMVMKFKVAFHNKNLIYKMYKKCEPKYYSASMKTNNILFDKKQIDYQQYINSMNEMVNLKLKGSLNQANTNLPEQIQENIIDQYSKFAMPIGWGWTYPFIKYTTAILIFAKTSMNISWLSFFALSGIIIRVLMLPFLIKQVILVHKQAKVSSHIKLIGHATFGSKLKFYLKIKYFLKAVFQYSSSVKVNPVVLVAYNLFQIPIFFLMIFSIRKISFDENLINEGVLWFRNLNEPDPYMVLPIVSVLMTYYNLGRGINKDNEHWMINRWRSFFQILQIMFLPITCNWPAGSHIYWITSTIFIFVQNSILRHPRVMSKINPTFYSDMQRVFFSERSKSDSDRYIKKLKNCEDPYIKAPTTSEEVTLSLNYELREMKKMKRIFQYRKIKENAYGIASTKLRKTILKIHS